MFFSEETFEKYSLFGPFENQLKNNAINQTDSNFEVIPFLNCCNRKKQNYCLYFNKILL